VPIQNLTSRGGGDGRVVSIKTRLAKALHSGEGVIIAQKLLYFWGNMKLEISPKITLKEAR